MVRTFLLTVVLAGCSVRVVDLAPASPDSAERSRIEVAQITRTDRASSVGDGGAESPEDTVIHAAHAGELRPVTQFGGQEGEPVTSPPGDAPPPAMDDADADGDGASDPTFDAGAGGLPTEDDTTDTDDTDDTDDTGLAE